MFVALLCRLRQVVEMNILFCSKKTAFGTEPVGGAETSMRLMAEALARSDNSSVYLIFGTEKKVPTPGPCEIDGITIYYYFTSRFFLIERIAGKLGIKRLAYTLERSVSKFVLGRLLKALIARHDIGVVYTSYDRDILLPLIDLKRKKIITAKIVMRMAGLYWYERAVGNDALVDCYEYIFNNVDAINYLSPSFKKLAESKMHELNMRVSPRNEFICDIGSGMAPNHENILKKCDSKEFLIVVIMRFSDYQKRQDVLLHALAIIKDVLPVKAMFIGSGICRQEMVGLANELGVAEQVVFAEHMHQQVLWQEMDRADMLCHPCEYEGVSKIILESMALGLPVLASNVTPLQDYVCDGETGFLVDNDPEAWAEKIIFFYNNRDMLNKVSINAAKYIKEHHSPDKNILEYIEHFKSLSDG